MEDIYNILNPKMIIVTRGKKGSDFVFDNNKVNKELSNPSVEVDPTGAGDAFFQCLLVSISKTTTLLIINLLIQLLKKQLNLQKRL